MYVLLMNKKTNIWEKTEKQIKYMKVWFWYYITHSKKKTDLEYVLTVMFLFTEWSLLPLTPLHVSTFLIFPIIFLDRLPAYVQEQV